MHPALLLLAGGGFILASRKQKKRKKSSVKPVTTSLQMVPVEVVPPTKEMTLLPGVKLHEFHLNKTVKPSRADAPGLLIYRGMPPNIAPAGYEPINVWVTVDGKTYAEPRRFVQFHEWKDAGETRNFLDHWAFAVSEGGKLAFYVLGKPTSTSKCCASIHCTRKTVRPSDPGAGKGSGTTVVEWESTTEGGGTPEGVAAQAIGAGPTCTCTRYHSTCFKIIRPTPQSWPTVQTKAP